MMKANRTIHYVNPSDQHYTKSRFVFGLGFGGTLDLLLVSADHLQDALDELIDFIVESDDLRGIVANDAVVEAYEEALAEGKSEEEAREWAEEDVTCGGNCSDYIHSGAWWIVAEDPSKEELVGLARSRRMMRW